MPLLLLVPLLFVAVLLALVVLVPLSLFMRYRRGTARQQARGWVAALNVVTLTISATLLLSTAAITTFWIPRAFPYTAAGFGGGVLLGLVGLRASRWESTPQSLHHTPNRWLVLMILMVVTSRILYGLWRVAHAWSERVPGTSWLAAAGVGGSMAAGAVVMGYYLTYWLGVRRRLVRHQRGPGVIDVTATRVLS